MADRDKVLLIRLSSLGDVVLATTAVEALAAARPELEIHLLTKPAFREIFEGNPAVAKLTEWEPGEGLGALACRIRAEGYAHVVDLHANLRTRLLRWLVRGPRWSVYRKGALRRRLAVKLDRPALLDTDTHVLDRYLAALAPLGVKAERCAPRMHLTPAQQEMARALLEAAGWDGQQPLIALAPGARWPTKAWLPARWKELAEGLVNGSGLFPVLIGGDDERSLCEEILAYVDGRGAMAAGRTSIGETAALLALCGRLITNDSAPLHLASAVGTPVTAIFGPTVRGFGFAPLGARDAIVERELSCRPCSLHGSEACPEGHFRCMEEVTVTHLVRTLDDDEGRG